MYGALLGTTETTETAVVPVFSGFFDKEDYILKLSQKNGGHLFQVFFLLLVRRAFS